MIGEVLSVVGGHRMPVPGVTTPVPTPVSAPAPSGPTVAPASDGAAKPDTFRRRRPPAAAPAAPAKSGDGAMNVVKPVADGGTPVIALPERGHPPVPGAPGLQPIDVELYAAFGAGSFDRRAIGAALQHAILIFFDVRDGVGDPDAGAEQQRDDRNRDDIHQHALPIIDRFVRVLLIAGEIVDG